MLRQTLPIDRARTLGLAVACALVVLVGCGRENAPTEESETPVVTDPVPGGTLRVAISADPGNLNPLTRSGTLSGNINGIINPGLVLMNTQLQWEPSLATHWTWSDDRLTLDYHIEPGLKWSDGVPFTSLDVVVSAGLYRNEDIGSTRRTNFVDMVAVTGLDEHTVRFEFSRVSPDQILNSAFPILPAHIVQDLDPQEVANWDINRMPITLGPYRIKERVAESRLVLERNPHWMRQPPYLDEIVFEVVPDEGSRLLKLRLGEVDMVEAIAPKDVARLSEDQPDIALYQTEPRTYGYLVYNLSRPPLDDRRVRQAISYAVDRRAMIEGVIYGHADPLATPIVPMHDWAVHPDLAPYPRDPERARALLAEAGWTDSDGDGIADKDGEPLRIEVRTRTGDLIRENGIIILQQNLRAIGIEAVPRPMEFSTTIGLVRAGDYDVYYGHSSSRMSVDPSGVFGSDGGFNYSGYANPEVDAIIRAGLAEEDRDLARPHWLRFQEIWYDDQPTSTLYVLKPFVAIHSRFRDCTPHALSPWEGIENWWMEPAAESR